MCDAHFNLKMDKNRNDNRITPAQRRAMLNFIEKNPEFLQRTFPEELKIDFAAAVNSIQGSTKSASQALTSWRDWKNKVINKEQEIAQGTRQKQLSELEKDLLRVLAGNSSMSPVNTSMSAVIGNGMTPVPMQQPCNIGFQQQLGQKSFNTPHTITSASLNLSKSSLPQTATNYHGTAWGFSQPAPSHQVKSGTNNLLSMASKSGQNSLGQIHFTNNSSQLRSIITVNRESISPSTGKPPLNHGTNVRMSSEKEQIPATLPKTIIPQNLLSINLNGIPINNEASHTFSQSQLGQNLQVPQHTIPEKIFHAAAGDSFQTDHLIGDDQSRSEWNFSDIVPADSVSSISKATNDGIRSFSDDFSSFMQNATDTPNQVNSTIQPAKSTTTTQNGSKNVSNVRTDGTKNTTTTRMTLGNILNIGKTQHSKTPRSKNPALDFCQEKENNKEGLRNATLAMKAEKLKLLKRKVELKEEKLHLLKTAKLEESKYLQKIEQHLSHLAAKKSNDE